MANNKKVKIDFQANGIQAILDDIANLKATANKVHVPKQLEQQLDDLNDKVQDITSSIEDLQTALTSPKKGKKNAAVTEMDAKIDDLKKKISSVWGQINIINRALERSANDVTNVFSNLAQQDLSDLQNQLNNISLGFETLINQTIEFKKVLNQKTTMSKGTIGKLAEVGEKKQQNREAARKENPEVARLENVVSVLQERLEQETSYEERLSAKKYSEKVNKLAQTFSALIEDRKTKTRAESRGAIDAELLSIIKQFQLYLKAPEYSAYASAIDKDSLAFKQLFDFIKSGDASFIVGEKANNILKKNAENRGQVADAVNMLVGMLRNDIATIRNEVDALIEDPNSLRNQIQQVAKTEAKKKKKQVTLTVGIADDAEVELVEQLKTIVDNVNKAAPPINVKIDFVGKYKATEQTKIAQKLQESLDKLNLDQFDEETRQELTKLVADIRKKFSGDLMLKLDSNIPEFVENSERVIKGLRDDIRSNPLDMKVKFNGEEVQQAFDEVGSLKLNVGEITFDNKAIKDAARVMTAEEEQIAYGRQMEGITAVETDPVKELRDNLLSYLTKINKIPALLNKIKGELGVLDIKANVTVDKKQIQDALYAINDLELRVARLDIYQPSLDRIKLTVKEGLAEFVVSAQALSSSLSLFADKLSVQTSGGKNSSQKNAFATQLKNFVAAEAAFASGINDLVDTISNFGKIELSSENLKSIEVNLKDSSEINELVLAFKDIANKLVTGKIEQNNDEETKTETARDSILNEIKIDADNLDAIKGDVAAIKEFLISEKTKLGISAEDIDKIVNALKNNEDIQDNAFLKEILDWVKSDTVSKTNNGSVREKYLLGNTKTGETSLRNIAGDEDKVSYMLSDAIERLAKKINPDVDAHSHDAKYASPSVINDDGVDTGDLYKWANSGRKHVIAARNQIVALDYNVFKEMEHGKYEAAYKVFVDNYHKNILNNSVDAPVLSTKLKHSFDATDERNRLINKSWSKELIGALKETGIIKSNRKDDDQAIRWLSTLIKKNDIDFGFNDKDSVRGALTSIAKMAQKEGENSLSDKEINSAIGKIIKAGFAKGGMFTTGELMSGLSKNNDLAANLARHQMLKDAFTTAFPDLDFNKFFKVLNFKTANELTASALGDLIGSPASMNRQDVTNEILRDINENVIKIAQKADGISLSSVSEENTEPQNKAELRSDTDESSSKKGSKWFVAWDKENQNKKRKYSNRLDDAIATYRKSVSQDDMSDLEYMNQFYDKYLEHLADDIDKAAKGKKKAKQKYKKYVEQKRKEDIGDLKSQQDKVEKSEDSLRRGVQSDKANETQRKINEAKEHEAQLEQERLAIEEANNQEILADEKKQEAQRKESLKAQQKITEARKKQQKASESQAEKEHQAEIKAGEDELKNKKKKGKEDYDKYVKGVEKSETEEQKKAKQAKIEEQRKQKVDEKYRPKIDDKLSQLQTWKSNPYVDPKTKGNIDDLIVKIKDLQKQGLITKDVYDEVNGTFKEIAKQAGSDIKATKNNLAQQTKENEDRMKQISKMSSKVESLLDNSNLLGSSRQSANDFLEKLKEIQKSGHVTADVFDEIESEFKDVNVQADEEISAQKEMIDLAERLEKIKAKQYKDESFYMPDYLREIDNARELIRARREEGESLSLDEKSYIAGLIGQTENPSQSILRGNKTVLQNYITKGEKMLATNYMPGALQSQLKEVVMQMRNLEGQTDVSRRAIDELTDSFRRAEMEAAKAGKTFMGQVGQRLKDMNAKFIATYFSFMDIIRYTRMLISTLTELDTALTEMRKVSDESIESLKTYQKTTFDTAGALGTTAVQLQQSTADWMRLGESMDQAAESAKAATMLFNVSEFENINEATTALVAMSQAYKDMDKTEIIDVMNNIGNSYSIATDQLATALQASASSLMVQGNDLYEAAALVTAGNAVIQDASKVGTGLRTISLRIAGVKEGDETIKEELAELGEEVDEWVVSTQAKKRQVIMDYTRVAANNGEGVDILDSNGNLRDTYHILLDIAKVYKDIQEEDKKYGTNRANALVEELAGKNRSNIAASILMNPELLEDVYNSAIDSAGSAAEENAKYLDSIVGKTQQFKNELQELEQNVVSSEMIKDVIDLGTGFLSLLNSAEEKLPEIIRLVGSLAVALIALKNQWGGLIQFNKENGDFGIFGVNVKGVARAIDKRFTFDSIINGERGLNIADSNGNIIKPMQALGNQITGIWDDVGERIDLRLAGIRGGVTGLFQGVNFQNEKLRMLYEFAGENGITDDMINELSQFDEEAGRMATTLRDNGVTTLEQFSAAEKSAGTAARVASVGVNILNSAITMGVGLLLSWSIGKVIEKIKGLADASKDAADRLNSFNDSVKTAREENQNQASWIEENAKEYAELAKEVDLFGNNLSLSTDEFKRYNELSNEIASMFPSLVKGWTETGDAILYSAENVELLNEAYEKTKKEKLSELLTGTGDNSPSVVFENYQELLRANPFEKIFHTKEGTAAGVTDNFEDLYRVSSAFADLTWEQYQEILKTYDKMNEEGGNIAAYFEGQYYDALMAEKPLGITVNDIRTEGAFEAARVQAQAYVDTFDLEMESALKGIRDLGLAYLELSPSYSEMDENSKKIAQEIVNSLDRETVDEFESNPLKLGEWVAKSVSTVQSVKVPASDLLSINTNKGSLAEAKSEMGKLWREVAGDLDSQISELDTQIASKQIELQNKNIAYEDRERIQADIDALEQEKDRINDLKGDIYDMSGLGDIEEFYSITQKSISAIAKDGYEQVELFNFTKDFTKEQWELWLKVTNATMNAVAAEKAYNEEASKITPTRFNDIGALLNSGTVADTQKSWAEIKEELIDLSQAGKLDESTLKEYDYFDEILKELGISADKADEAISGMIEEINKMAQQNAVDVLKSYKDGVDNLNDAYQKFKNGEFIDASTLSSIQDVFGDLDSYDEFEEAVLRGEEDLQEYFDAIVTEYALQESALSELTEENRDWVKQQLIASGITEESAEKSIEQTLRNKQVIEGEIRATIESMNAKVAKNEATKDLVVSTADLDNVTAKEIVLLMNEAGISGQAAQAVAMFALKKQLAKQQDLRNQDDLNYLVQLIDLAEAGGERVLAVKRLIEDQQNAQSALDKFFAKYGRDSTKWNNAQLAQYNQLIQNQKIAENSIDSAWSDFSKKAIDEVNKNNPELDITANVDLDYGGIADDAANAGEDAAAAFKDALDKILAMYDAELDAGVISFKDYVDKSRGIIEEYYREGKITAAEYYDYIASLYEKRVSEYDKVVSAVQRRIQKEVESLEKQKETIEESYNLQIEEIQKKIDVLQEENDEIDKNLALSKAQYQLARQQHQRTKLMYSESRGFYYEADLQGIAEAQENVRKAQLDKTVSDLQKRITELQNSMKKETDEIDKQIKSLNEWAEEWSHVSEILKEEMEDQRAIEIIGQNWEEDILNQRREVLEQFTKDYVALQEEQKKAYLDARTAEAGAAVNSASGSGSGSGGSGNGGTYTRDNNNEDVYDPYNPERKYYYDGQAYPTITEAEAAKQADIRRAGEEAYQKAYSDAMEKHKNDPIPDVAKKGLAEKAAREAREAAENRIKNRQIKAAFSGTDSAKPGETLVGELGSEIVLHKNGTASVVDSPTLMNMKGGEKVFNAEETEKILKSKYVPLKKFNPKKFAMLHAFANGTSSPMQSMIAAQAVGIANGLNKGLIATSSTGGQTINQTFNVSLPNITDSSKATELFKEFEQLQRKATQFFN